MKPRFSTSGSNVDMPLEIEALVTVTLFKTYLDCTAVEREEHLTHRFLNAISVEILVTDLRNKITFDIAILVSRELLIRKGEKILIKIVEFTGDEKVKNGKL